MKLISVLNPDLIFFDIEGNSREEIYLSLFNKIKESISIPDETDHQVLHMMKREDTAKIPYEKGVALPHTRTSTVTDLHIGIGILKEPVKLKDNDIDPANIIIMSLISEKTSDVYLLTISAFCKYLAKAENSAKFAKTATPEELIKFIDEENIEIKHNITAEEVMEVDFPYVKKDDSIATALDIFIGENKKILPVLKESKELDGVIDAYAILKKAVPEYMLMMDNLNFLTSFEPFEKFLNEEEDLKVKDLMREPKAVIKPDTPLIQLSVSLIKDEAVNLFVVDDEQKLIGVISIRELIKNVLRG